LYCRDTVIRSLLVFEYTCDIKYFCLLLLIILLKNSLQDKDQRSMDMETARVMLQLLLGKHWPLFTQFAQFLDQSKYKVINKDQWCNILEFSRTINHDLSNYDLDGACKCTGGIYIDFSKNIEDHLTYMQDYVVTIIVAFLVNVTAM